MAIQASLFDEPNSKKSKYNLGVIAIESAGTWFLWGETYPHKNLYKKNDLWWDHSRSAWLWKEGELPAPVADTVTNWLGADVVQPTIEPSEALTQVEAKLGMSIHDFLNEPEPQPLSIEGLPNWFTPPSWWELIQTYIHHRPGIAVVGPAGNGKTTTVEMALKAADIPYISISCTDRTEVVELVGGYVLTAEGEQWRDGDITQAFREGYAVILDEADALDSRVLMSLQNALQDAGADGQARYINTPNGRIYPADKCPIVMCMNTFGDGGNREYNSRNKLDAASRDRLTYISTDYENEVLILKARGYKTYTAKRIVEKVQTIRKRINDNALPVVISPRTMLNIAQAIETFGWSPERAFEVELFGKIPPTYHPFIKEAS